MARVKRAVNAKKKPQVRPRKGQGLLRPSQPQLQDRQRSGHARVALRVRRSARSQGRLPSVVDQPHQRRVPSERHELQRVHQRAQARRCRCRPQDPRRHRRHRRGGLHRTGDRRPSGRERQGGLSADERREPERSLERASAAGRDRTRAANSNVTRLRRLRAAARRARGRGLHRGRGGARRSPKPCGARRVESIFVRGGNQPTDESVEALLGPVDPGFRSTCSTRRRSMASRAR